MRTVVNFVGFIRRHQVTYVYLFTSDWYCAGVMAPVANFVKVVTKLPNMRSINGRMVPAAMAATKAMVFRAQLVRSAYLNIRYQTSENFTVPQTTNCSIDSRGIHAAFFGVRRITRLTR